MAEIVRAVAVHRATGIDWNVSAGLKELEGLYEIFDAADRYLMDHPGHRLIVSIERDDGILSDTPSPGLLAGRADL